MRSTSNSPSSEPSAPPGATLILFYNGTEVGRLSMHFLHDGIPTPSARPSGHPSPAPLSADRHNPRPSTRDRDCSSKLLSHPNIASKHWIIRQYDHEVQGNTILKPLVGPLGAAPPTPAVIEPVPGTNRGIAIACGLQTPVGDPDLGGDPYQMVLAAIDECVRNLVCVGADPTRIAILDNFCWPSCEKPGEPRALVRAAEGQARATTPPRPTARPSSPARTRSTTSFGPADPSVFDRSGALHGPDDTLNVSVTDLISAWRATLDW
jgi:phosphoribosylformylglycinamidine (FGAM) synthase-like enzyme